MIRFFFSGLFTVAAIFLTLLSMLFNGVMEQAITAFASAVALLFALFAGGAIAYPKEPSLPDV